MELHLAEAARPMGFKVVEDSKGVEIDPVKEVSMEKKEMSRICEVLGVEVGEAWAYPEFSEPFRINQNGYREYKSKDGVWYLCQAEEDLTEIINHPNRIIRKPRFTEEEVADAKALVRILGATGIERTAYGGNLCAVIGEAAKVVIGQGLFPSLRPGQAVKLSDIIREGRHGTDHP